jgi:hypothetical protein
VKGGKELRLGSSQAEIDDLVAFFYRMFEAREKYLSITEAAGAQHFYTREFSVWRNASNDPSACSAMTGGIASI